MRTGRAWPREDRELRGGKGRRQCLHVPKRLLNRRDPRKFRREAKGQSDREAEFKSV